MIGRERDGVVYLELRGAAELDTTSMEVRGERGGENATEEVHSKYGAFNLQNFYFILQLITNIFNLFQNITSIQTATIY